MSIAEDFLDWSADNVLPWFLAILLIICGLAIVGGIGYGIHYWIAGDGEIHSGVVISKEFIPEHTDMIFNAATKTTMPMTIPDRYEVTLEGLADKTIKRSSFSLPKTDWERVEIGKELKVD